MTLTGFNENIPSILCFLPNVICFTPHFLNMTISFRLIYDDITAFLTRSLARVSHHPTLRAAAVHQAIVWAQPFGCGNLALARMAMQCELLRAGFPAVVISSADATRTAYCAALVSSAPGAFGSAFDVFLARELKRALWLYTGKALPN